MEITLLDGSIGQELVKRAGDEPTPLWSTSVLLDKPELVTGVHRDYFNVGATIATTNTYAVLADRLQPAGLENRLEDLWQEALQAARQARNANGFGRVAASIGPLQASYRPDICPPAEEAEVLYEDIVRNLAQGADILLIETMSSVNQAEGALRAACKAGKPVWLGITVSDEDGTRLRSGEPLADLTPVLKQHELDAILVNCSLPEVTGQALDIIKQFELPFGAYANGFTRISEGFLEDRPTVSALTARQDLSPERYADFAMAWVNQGATIVGGCCEVGPEHILELSKRLASAGHTIV